MWSIYSTSAQGPAKAELDYLSTIHKTPSFFDGHNKIIVQMHPNPTNPIVIGDATNSEGEPLTAQERVVYIAKLLFDPVRDRAIHLTKAEASELSGEPAWKLWCGQYEDKESLEVDHETVFGVGVDRRKTIDTLIDESRTNLKQYFTGQ